MTTASTIGAGGPPRSGPNGAGSAAGAEPHAASHRTSRPGERSRDDRTPAQTLYGAIECSLPSKRRSTDLFSILVTIATGRFHTRTSAESVSLA